MNFKGTGWITMIKYFNECHTPEDREKLKAALDDKTRELFESNYVLPFSWIDYGTYIKTMVTADKVIGRGDFELIKQINYFTARQDIKGVYKFIVSLLSPKTVIQAAGILFKQIFNKGTLVLENLTSNSATIVMKEVDDIPLHHDVDQGAYIEEILKIAGAKNPTFTHPQCMARGDPCCRFEISWK
jgi:hypothetical protein